MRREAGGRRRGGLVRDLVVIAAVALVASVLIKTFLVRSFFIPSASMEDTLLGEPGHHDRILVDELVPRVVPLQRGDVIVFTDPGGWLTGQPAAASSPLDAVLSVVGLSAQDSAGHLVKRVIGLPGDRVSCCNGLGQMSVDGVPLQEPYVRLPAGVEAVSREPFDVRVPAGHLWVMGDNRYDSADSRIHGAVPVDDVVGRAFVISWPIDRWSWLSSHAETFAGVP